MTRKTVLVRASIRYSLWDIEVFFFWFLHRFAGRKFTLSQKDSKRKQSQAGSGSTFLEPSNLFLWLFATTCLYYWYRLGQGTMRVTLKSVFYAIFCSRCWFVGVRRKLKKVEDEEFEFELHQAGCLFILLFLYLYTFFKYMETSRDFHLALFEANPPLNLHMAIVKTRSHLMLKSTFKVIFAKG